MRLSRTLMLASLLACMACSVAVAAPMTAWERDAAVQEEALEMNRQYDAQHGYYVKEAPSATEVSEDMPMTKRAELAEAKREQSLFAKAPAVIKPEKTKARWEIEVERDKAIQDEGLDHNRKYEEQHRR